MRLALNVFPLRLLHELLDRLPLLGLLHDGLPQVLVQLVLPRLLQVVKCLAVLEYARLVVPYLPQEGAHLILHLRELRAQAGRLLPVRLQLLSRIH